MDGVIAPDWGMGKQNMLSGSEWEWDVLLRIEGCPNDGSEVGRAKESI